MYFYNGVVTLKTISTKGALILGCISTMGRKLWGVFLQKVRESIYISFYLFHIGRTYFIILSMRDVILKFIVLI